MYSLPIRDGDLAVDPEALNNLMAQAATVHNGGTFPAGADEVWHGGVHIGPPSTNISSYAPFPGTVIAARLGVENTDRYGSPNFLLLRHTWPPFGDDPTPFYSLYMHLAPTDPGIIATDPNTAPWLVTDDLLRVTTDGLTVRSHPTTDRIDDSSTEESEPQSTDLGSADAGERFPVLEGPLGPDDHRWTNDYEWYRVDLSEKDRFEAEAAYLASDGDFAEVLAATIEGAAATALQNGDVAALDIDVAAGTQLWWNGMFGLPESEVVDILPVADIYRQSPTLHWEVFAGEPVLGHENGAGDGSEVGAWNAVEDDNDNYEMDPEEVGVLHDHMEALWSDSEMADASEADSFADAGPEERVPFYIQMSPLRRTAAKFRSEWDPQNEAADMGRLAWWGEDEDPLSDSDYSLPDSSITWHYHPVGALEAIRPRFTAEGDSTTLDGPVETIDDVAEKVIEAFGYSGDLFSLSESEFDRVQSEMHGLSINAAAPATEEPEYFASVEFAPKSVGYKEYNGQVYTFGLVESEYGPDLYEMLEGNNPRDGVPGRTPPEPEDGGPPPDDQWAFDAFDQDVWASITESEGSLQAINTWDSAFLSGGPVQQTAGRNEGKGELQGALHTLKANAPDVYWHHFGRFGLRPVDASIMGGAKKAHFKLRGEVLDTEEQKERLRSFKWAHRFQQSMLDPAVRYWIMREGFKRLERIRDRTLLLTVDPPSREGAMSFYARIGDLFQRDLMQALLLDWHVNYPAEVWMQQTWEWDMVDGERVYDPGNRWRGPLQDHLATWAGQWSQTLTEALPFAEDDQGNLDRDDNGHLTLDGPLDLSDTEAYQLTASLLEARMPPAEMTDSGIRAGKILAYSESDDIEQMLELEDYTK